MYRWKYRVKIRDPDFFKICSAYHWMTNYAKHVTVFFQTPLKHKYEYLYSTAIK